MTRDDLTELHYITAIANVPSILQIGILSNKRAEQEHHESVAMVEVQARRNKQIPGARGLHEYANLYLDAHNPMLSKVRGRNNSICVLRIHAGVLDLEDIIIADRNAASDYVSFLPVEIGLKKLNRERVFAEFWTHPGEPFEEMAHKSEKCAEVLVPDVVEPRFILGAYVANQFAFDAIKALHVDISVSISADLFF